MIVGIHQPNFLPWLGYFYKMSICDTFVYLDSVPFSKGSYTNRVQIKSQSGPRWVTVPVLTSGRLGQNIVDLAIDDHSDWRRKVLATLEGCYGGCQHFQPYFRQIKQLITSDTGNLCELNIELVEYFAGQLDIKAQQVRASKLSARGKATDLLIGLCKEIGADTYLSGSGGADYQDEQAFADADLKLVYTKYKHPQYPQASLSGIEPLSEFVAGMSIVDLLFNCGPQSSDILRSGQVTCT